MKRVIRKGVFETNSSSSHSLTIRKSSKMQGDVIDEDASFEIRSPLAKVVQMLGLIDNAENDFLGMAHSMDSTGDSAEVKQAIINQFKEEYPEVFEGVDGETISAKELAERLVPIVSLCSFDTLEFFDSFEDSFVYTFYYMDSVNRSVVLSFKEKMLNEFCKIEGLTMEQAMEQIEFEAFGNKELKEILKDETTAEPKLKELLNVHFYFRHDFEKSGEKDIVAFAKKFIYTDLQRFKENRDGRFPCCIYFNNSCLDECYCGMESYYELAKALKIDEDTSDEEMQKKVEFFLSRKSKIVAIEKYCGHIFEKTGEIF